MSDYGGAGDKGTANGDKNPASVAWAENCWKRLLSYFGAMKAHAVSSAAIRGYIEARKAMGAANGTINRELSVLSSAFTLGFEETPRRVSHQLSFKRLPESKPRHALAKNCSELYMCAMLALAYSFGFRKAELLSLKASDVDLLAGTVRLRTSKNGEPRQVNLTKRHEGVACVLLRREERRRSRVHADGAVGQARPRR